MVLERPIVPFLAWLPGALVHFLVTAAAVGVGVFLFSLLVCVVRFGPQEGGLTVYRVVSRGFLDLFRISPRRVAALTRLAIQEAVRRKVLVVFAVFLAVMLFAGWFLQHGGNEPARLYLSFVLTTTTYLILLLALFLSVFSLPNDVKNKTIYTIVTKPVRAGEMVLGRIIGFAIVGTVMLAAMGLFSYVFVLRAIRHTHDVIQGEQLGMTVETLPERERLRTTTSHNHYHGVIETVEGGLSTDQKFGHWHPIEVRELPGRTEYVVGQPRGVLRARVPLYGKLTFLDRAGQPTDKGVNTGNEWTYRSFIEGGTSATAIWTFQGVTPKRFPPEDFPHGIPMEMTLRVFRTYKGDVESGIPGSYFLRNPITGKESRQFLFRATEYATDQHYLPFEMEDKDGKPIKLFDDLVRDGTVELRIRCRAPAQYFGMAQADVWLNPHDGSFTWNFAKGFIGIWIQMFLVTGFGVMFSTFLNGAVAMLATISTLIIGFFTDFILGVATNQIKGGGPIESFIRLLTQKNVTSDLDPTVGNITAQTIDVVLMAWMRGVSRLLPNFGEFDWVAFVANGFNVPADLMLQNVVGMLGYLVAVLVAGYFFLATREVAK